VLAEELHFGRAAARLRVSRAVRGHRAPGRDGALGNGMRPVIDAFHARYPNSEVVVTEFHSATLSVRCGPATVISS
jgi:DNA-binding transcriptional LysR family regulator